MYSDFDEGFVRSLHERQLKIIQYLKKKAAQGGPKKAMGVALVIDDFIDMPSVVRKANGILSSIAIRGRHGNLTCIYLTQKYRALVAKQRFRAKAVFSLAGAP